MNMMEKIRKVQATAMAEHEKRHGGARDLTYEARLGAARQQAAKTILEYIYSKMEIEARCWWPRIHTVILKHLYEDWRKPEYELENLVWAVFKEYGLGTSKEENRKIMEAVGTQLTKDGFEVVGEDGFITKISWFRD